MFPFPDRKESQQSLEGWLYNPTTAQPSKNKRNQNFNMKKTAMDEKKIENKKQRKQKSQNERNRNPRVYTF